MYPTQLTGELAPREGTKGKMHAADPREQHKGKGHKVTRYGAALTTFRTGLITQCMYKMEVRARIELATFCV